jgi:hypothetical protein
MRPEKHRAPRSFPFNVGVSRCKKRSAVLDSVNDVETTSLKGSLTVCESPVCSVEFEPSRLYIKPKRFCCDQCKMHAWVIRRASKLLDGLTDEKKLEIMKVEP